MSPKTAISSQWHAVFIADYVKEHLALVAIDEAHCIVDWLVLYLTLPKYIVVERG